EIVPGSAPDLVDARLELGPGTMMGGMPGRGEARRGRDGDAVRRGAPGHQQEGGHTHGSEQKQNKSYRMSRRSPRPPIVADCQYLTPNRKSTLSVLRGRRGSLADDRLRSGSDARKSPPKRSESKGINIKADWAQGARDWGGCEPGSCNQTRGGRGEAIDM